MHAAPVLLSLSLLSLSSGQSSSPSPSPAPSLVTTCTFNNGSTSFGQWDLSPLTQMASTYITTDLRDSTKKYYYNFCRAAFAEVAAGGQVYPGTTSACNFPTGASGRAGVGNVPALAWQYDDESAKTCNPAPCADNCYRLGQQTSSWSFSIYDEQKPAKGVVITYPMGDSIFCPPNKKRSFSVEVLCSGSQGSLAAFTAASVVEANTCDYRLQVKSLAGCPTACITGGSLCNGAGVCGFNSDARRVQCFCNAGYSGGTCGTHTNSASRGLSTEGVILIIVCIMLAGVLGLVGYMYIRLRKLNVDPSAYGDLAGKYNELSMVA